MPPEVRVLAGAAERAAAVALRFEVFVDEQRCPADEEVDALDAEATHFGVFLDGRLEACARVVDVGGGGAKIGRVAVRAARRGEGLGRVVMDEVLAWCRARGFRRAVLDAQCQALAFYERLGFVPEGEVFLEAGIEHRHMTRPLG